MNFLETTKKREFNGVKKDAEHGDYLTQTSCRGHGYYNWFCNIGSFICKTKCPFFKDIGEVEELSGDKIRGVVVCGDKSW